MLLPKKTYKVFDRDVEFSIDEVQNYQKEGLSLSNAMIEYCLTGEFIFELSSNMSDQDVKILCQDALNKYIEETEKIVKLATFGL